MDKASQFAGARVTGWLAKLEGDYNTQIEHLTFNKWQIQKDVSLLFSYIQHFHTETERGRD